MDNNGTPLYTLWEKRRKLRIRLIVVLVLCIVLFVWLRPHIFPAKTNSQGAASSGSSQNSSPITKASPDFADLTPSGKGVEWSRLSPPNSASFYVYTDTISGVPIRVSEQTLPSSLKSDDQVAELAKNYSANRSIDVGGTTVYIGTSAKQTQSIIFVKRSLLILITSNDVLNDHQWNTYISSLQ
jgi:cytoskeletal protein RodZ